MKLILTLALLFSLTTYSQLLVKDRIGSNNGLPSDVIYEIIQDKNNNLWFATELGVCSYNGFEYNNYGFSKGLPDNSIYEIKITNDQKKWFLSGNGKLSYLDPLSDQIAVEDSLSFNAFISELFRSIDGKLVVSSFGDGIKIKDGEEYHHITQKDNLTSNFVSFIWEKENFIYLISSKGISRIDQNYKVENIHTFKSDIHFTRACKISDEGVIFSTKKQLFYLGGNDELIPLKNSKSLVERRINKLNFLDNYIVASTNMGSFICRMLDDSIAIDKAIVSDVSTTSILKDHENNYWVSCLVKGAFYLQKNDFCLVGKPDKAFFLNTDEEDLYIGYENFTYGIMRESILTYHRLPGDNYNKQKIRSIIHQQDTNWFLFDGGIAVQDQNKKTATFYRPPCRDFIFKDDKILIGGLRGYITYKKSLFLSNLQVDNESFVDSIFEKTKNDLVTNCIKTSGDSIFIGTDQGLYIENQDRITKVNHSVLSKAKIKHIFINDEAKLICTYGFGVFYLTQSDTIYFSKNDGLLSDFCKVAKKYQNKVFIGTNKGLNVINLPFKKGDKVFSTSIREGKQNNNIQDIAHYNDSIYLATLGGVYSISISDLYRRKIHPILRIEEIKVNGTPININEVSSYRYDKNRFSFEMTPVTFAYKDRVIIEYKLSEKSKNWISSKSRYLEFNSLSPGSYNFKARAKIDNYTSSELTYNFVISPPFWKQWWFILLIAFSTSLLIYFFFKIRILTYNRDVVRELIKIFIEKLKKEDHIIVKNIKDGSLTKINLSQILYVNSSRNYVELVTVSGKTLVRKTLKEIHKELNSFKKHEFIRCHKSYVINKKRLSAVHGDFLKIQNERIPIGKSYLNRVSHIKNLL